MSQPVSYYLNLSQTPAGQAFGTLLNGATWEGAAAITQVTSGTVTTRLHLFNDANGVGSAPNRITAENIIFAVRKNPDSADLIVLQTTWSQQGDAGSEYYEAEVNWDVVAGTWKKGEEDVFPLADITVDGRAIRVPMALQRSAYDSGDVVANPQLYVKTIAQTLTSEQQAQVRTNTGTAPLASPAFTGIPTAPTASVGTNTTQVATTAFVLANASSFDPASPGPIGDTTPSTIAATSYSAYNGNQGFAASAISLYGYTTGDVTTWTIDQDTGNITATGSGTFAGGMIANGNSWFGATLNSGIGTLASSAGLSGYDDSNTNTWSINNEFGTAVFNDGTFGTLSAASGAFTIGATGDLTATHGKFQGSAGIAGHVVLSQGTAPNGTGSTTTLWGIANGIGYRNGTGTAYDLTLPTSSGTLALVSGALGTPSSVTLTNATGLPLTGLTGTLTPAVNTTLSPNAMIVAYPSDSAWTATTISGAAAFSGLNAGLRYVSINATTAGLVRHAFSSGGGHLPGTGTVSGFTVDWSKSWSATWVGQNRCAVANGTTQSVIFGCPTTQANHTLTSKSVRVTIDGNGTNVRISITAYNTVETTSSVTNITTDDRTFYNYELEWTAGSQFRLYRNGTLVATLSTGLPTGTGTAGHNNICMMSTQLAGSATVMEHALSSILWNHF